MPTPDVLTALQTLLVNDMGVGPLVEGRVFRTSLPDSEAQNMPRNAIVISRAGGRPTGGYLPVARHRVDARCYGGDGSRGSVRRAYDVWAAMHNALKNLRPRVIGNCHIYACDPEGGVVDTVEPEVEWPLQWSSYLVTYSEVAVAA